jgi:hypothetical protein
LEGFQIAITGRRVGVFFTRISANALDMGLEAIAGDHGMAMRGLMISTLKVGLFRGPLMAVGRCNARPTTDRTTLSPISSRRDAFLNDCFEFPLPSTQPAGLEEWSASANLVLLGLPCIPAGSSAPTKVRK